MIFSEPAEESGRTTPPLSHDIKEYETTAKKSVSSGQMLTAIEVARDGIKRYGANKILQQQLALALAQTGALDGAKEVLGELMKESASDEETLCLLGRVYKELWRRASDPKVAADAIQQSCKFYGDAFALQEGYYPGINYAFTLAAAGELAKADAIARKVEKTCRKALKENPAEPDGWVLATLAEALTHQGATVEAGENYRKAAEAFKGRWRDLASMRRQAHEILGFASKAPESSRLHWYDLATIRRRIRDWTGQSEKSDDWLDKCFEFPSIVVFSGHMLDRPGRTPPRFPPEREAQIRDEIKKYLTQVKPGFGYSSAACGADIIFCECLMEMGANLHLVLPCPVAAFKAQSVSFAGPEWERRFHTVLSLASTCLIANPADYARPDGANASQVGLIYSNRIVTGLAVLQAQALDFELHALAVWDGKTNGQDGGTGSVVAEWKQRQLDLHVIPIAAGDTVGSATPPTAATKSAPAAKSDVRHEIKAVVCAEVTGYKKIGEYQLTLFIEQFKGAVAQLLETTGTKPDVSESWGPSLHFIYDSLPAAATFALELRDLVGRTNWVERGLPEGLAIRVVLHAGPVFACVDPVLKRTICVGSHLARAARIEPITPQGQVYATQEFAALCSGEDLSAVSFEFLGHLRTAKLLEEAPLYRLDRRRR